MAKRLRERFHDSFEGDYVVGPSGSEFSSASARGLSV
jgi:hypothetical protein